MAIISDELLKSRKTSIRKKGSTVEFNYVLESSDNNLDLLAYLEATAAPFYHGLILSEINLEQEGPETWLASLVYGDPDLNRNKEQPETGESEFSFSTVGGTEHIELALSPNVGYSAPGAPPRPNVQNIIGLSKDGNGVQVEGVDILVPHTKFSETHYLPASMVTINYVNTLSTLTGTTNDAPFRGFDIGEVLFSGASGNRRGRGDWAVTFDFEISKNKANFPIGQILVGWKPGWEYVWTMFEDAVSNNQLIRRPLHAFVCQVYSQGDFSGLGIGS